jgi:hypothetical protein
MEEWLRPLVPEVGEACGLEFRILLETILLRDCGIQKSEFDQLYDSEHVTAHLKLHALLRLRKAAPPVISSQPTFGDILRCYRLLKGWTTERLAREVLIGKQSVVDYEGDKASPRPETLAALVNTLEIPADILIGVI